MALYEPTLFALLDAETPAPNEAEGIRNAVADASAALDAGNPDAAAERFIDYWMGTRKLEADARATQGPDRGVGKERPPVGARSVH